MVAPLPDEGLSEFPWLGHGSNSAKSRPKTPLPGGEKLLAVNFTDGIVQTVNKAAVPTPHTGKA
jgi:hypothetical protein